MRAEGCLSGRRGRKATPWSPGWATCGCPPPPPGPGLSCVAPPASVRINGWTRPANSAAWPSACWSTCTSEGLRAIALPDPPSGRRGTRRRSLRLPPETPPTAGGHAAPPVVLPLQRGGPPAAVGGPGPIRDRPDAPFHSRHVRPHDHLGCRPGGIPDGREEDRKSTRLNSSHLVISYAVFCLKKKKK